MHLYGLDNNLKMYAIYNEHEAVILITTVLWVAAKLELNLIILCRFGHTLSYGGFLWEVKSVSYLINEGE